MPRVRSNSCVLPLALAAALVLGWTGCGRIGYDRLDQIDGGGWSSGGGGSGGGPVNGSGGSGGAAGTGGVTGSDGAAASDGAAGGDAIAPNASCSQAGTPTRVWSFPSDLEGWELSGSGTLSWNAAVGDPAPGALEVDWNDSTTTHPRLVAAFGDLSGRIITGEVWLDAGTGVTAKLFFQTGTHLVWADGGTVALTPGQWTCLAVDVDNPAFSRNKNDPTDVAIVGVELQGSGASRIYLDQVAF